jgi:hypothetical protein
MLSTLFLAVIFAFSLSGPFFEPLIPFKLMFSQLISHTVIWKVLSCDFLAHNCLFMVDLILILNF